MIVGYDIRREEQFSCFDGLRTNIETRVNSEDQHFAMIDSNTVKAVGMIELKRVNPLNGVLEDGAAMFFININI